MTVPRPLEKGNLIALVAPSSPTWVEGGVASARVFLEGLGFRVVEGASCSKFSGYLAGDDLGRAEDLNRFFADPNVDAIFCIRGGYGAMRIVPFLDLDLIRANPKIFLGYSDITILHTIFNRECGFVTYHGPMPATELIDRIDDFSLERFLDVLGARTSPLPSGNPSGMELQALRGGTARGILCGGNLTLLSAMIGTGHEIDTRGKILFLEDVDEEPFDVDRMLTQMSLAGLLENCVGFMLGDWNNCESRGSYKESQTLDEVLRDRLLPLGKPVLAGIRAGHCRPLITLALGLPVELDCDSANWRYL